MHLVYSDHAKKRMNQRGITPLEVEFVLKHPVYVKKSRGVHEAVGHIKDRHIKIVFEEIENYIRVISILNAQ